MIRDTINAWLDRLTARYEIWYGARLAHAAVRAWRQGDTTQARNLYRRACYVDRNWLDKP